MTSPWRWSHGPAPAPVDDASRGLAAEVENLEAARDAKYREIRDAELDRQTGKLSDADFRAIDSGLRAEAIEILRTLDRTRKRLEKLRAKAAEPAEPVSTADDPADGDGQFERPEPDAAAHRERG